MNLGQYLANILLEAEAQPTISLFPGAFKPPHKGHVDVVNKLLKASDQVVVLISPKTREGITADESVAVWNLYKDKGLFDGSVEIKISSAPTPVKEVYDVVEENPDTEFLVAFGKGEISRYKTIEKFPNVKIFDAGEVEGISATGLRMALAQKNKEEIAKYIPDGVSVDEFLQALNTKPEETPSEQPPVETPTPEQPLQESPPIEFEQDDYQDYTLENRPKIEKASYVFNIPIDDMEYAFNGGREVVLNDDMWSNLQNSKSYKMKTLDDAIQHSLKLGINPKPYIDFIKQGKDMPLPLVLCYGQDKYYLVGGEVVLSLYRALGSIPTVLQGTLNLQTRQLHQPTSLGEGLINEYSEGLIKKLIQKFKQENPELNDDEIKKVIKRFDQVKDNVEQKDILKYTWNELVDTVTSIEPKRIKAGKINNGTVDNADLVYNQNGIRVYKGKDKKACVKYGHGYTFCISARGKDNMYSYYRAGNEEEGSPSSLPYFVFDDNRTSAKGKNGEYLDNTHLLVVMAEEPAGRDLKVKSYFITEANNKKDKWFETFTEAVQTYPQLKGLENVIKWEPISDTDIDAKIYKIEQEKEQALNNYIDENEPIDFFPIITKKDTTDILEGKKILIRLRISSPKLSQTFIRVIDNESNEEELENSISMMVATNYELNRFVIKGKTNIAYEQIPITDDIKQFLQGIIELSNKYDKQIAKIKLQSLNEGLNTNNDKQLLKKFIAFAIKELGIQKPPSGLTLSRDNNAAKSMHTFGTFNPNNDKIWLYVKNRNMADLLRTLAHELVHRKQAEDGRIDYNSGETGSEIENEANAMAGILLRKFGKQNEEIYQ